MAKRIAAEKSRAGLRHAVLYPNVTGRTKERIDSPKRTGMCWLVRHNSSQSISHSKCRERVSSGRMSCCVSLSLMFRLFFVSFPSYLLTTLKLRPFIQSFFVLRYACAPTATRS